MRPDWAPLRAIYAQVDDPHHPQGKRHPLGAILLLMMCVAALCGYTSYSYSAMSEWTVHYGTELLELLGFTQDRVPCKGWLSRLLRRLDVQALEARLSEWAESCRTAFLKYVTVTQRGPDPDSRPIPDHRPSDLQPVQAVYWEKRGDHSVDVGHALKYPYIDYSLLRRADDPELARDWDREAHLIF
ncbi:transposase family protein [Candidatus Poribacteria bacterium]|nr:transposase family protein [Candidatus Poribacteria bacterium]